MGLLCARISAKEVAERHQRLDGVGDQFQRSEHGHRENGAGNAPHPIPEDQRNDDKHRVERKAAGEQNRRDAFAFRNMDSKVEACG